MIIHAEGHGLINLLPSLLICLHLPASFSFSGTSPHLELFKSRNDFSGSNNNSENSLLPLLLPSPARFWLLPFFPFRRCICVHSVFICLFLLVYRECIRGARLWYARIFFISHVHSRARTHIPRNVLSLVCMCSSGSTARAGQSAALTEDSICLSFLHKRKWHRRALPGIIYIDRSEGHFKVQSSSFPNGQWKWLWKNWSIWYGTHTHTHWCVKYRSKHQGFCCSWSWMSK